MISVERCHRIRASHIGRIGRIVEPQSKVIRVYGRGGRIRTGVRTVDDRRRSASRSHHEGLDTEPSDEIRNASPVAVRLDVALIPRYAERRIRVDSASDSNTKSVVRMRVDNFRVACEALTMFPEDQPEQ